ncbi:hypothetical protein [Sphingobium sp.]|uniref:LysE family translocator n=1 Tax=Sphingobium sp. TaxID=1912891 RepID=UPI002CADA08D|nr:hypothetical protein [Sphingobium sp.]HUD92174.1 hypothetical protein [Sphingobium sp.]
MMLLPFLLAIWALLLTPGPTNTLIGLSGAQAGWRRTARLIPFELAAYLIVVLPIAMLGAEAMTHWPRLAIMVKLGAATWVLYLAQGLWRPPSEQTPAMVTPRRLFVTTMLNPKGLVFGMALLPSPHPDIFALHVALFAISVIMVAGLWAGLGATLGQRGQVEGAPWLRRAAACWLALLSGGLVLGAMPH